MTVCIAGIAAHNAILCVADRMLSTDSMKYEPPWAKIYLSGKYLIAVLWAGDAPLEAELLQDFGRRLESSQSPGRIADVVQLYIDAFRAALDRRVEGKLLKHHGVTWADFNAGRHSLDTVTARRLRRKIDDFREKYFATRPTAVIIAGQDESGPHIWRVCGDDEYCADMEGFAAIGSGCDAAVASLRATGFSKLRPPNEGFLLAYIAKKRGEAPPTVGIETDMAIIQEDAKWGHIDPNIIARIGAAYDVFRLRESEALSEGFSALTSGMQPLVDEYRRQAAMRPETSSKPTISESGQT